VTVKELFTTENVNMPEGKPELSAVQSVLELV
jgi:hypothetical protein